MKNNKKLSQLNERETLLFNNSGIFHGIIEGSFRSKVWFFVLMYIFFNVYFANELKSRRIRDVKATERPFF